MKQREWKDRSGDPLTVTPGYQTIDFTIHESAIGDTATFRIQDLAILNEIRADLDTLAVEVFGAPRRVSVEQILARIAEQRDSYQRLYDRAVYLDGLGDRKTDDDNSTLTIIQGALGLYPAEVGAIAGRIVELESAKAPVGSNGRLKVQAAEKVRQQREKKEVFPTHILLDTENSTYRFINSPAERDEKAEWIKKDPERFRMYRAEEIVPEITVNWK